MIDKQKRLQSVSSDSLLVVNSPEPDETALSKAYIGILGIQDSCHFPSRDIGYCA